MYHIWFYAECQLHSVSTSLFLCFGLCECYVCLVALQLVCFEGRQRCGQLGNSTVSAIVIVFDHEKLSCVSSAGFAKGTGIQLHTLHSLYHFNDESPIGQQRDQHEELLRRRQQVHLSDVTQLCSVMRFICFYISMESTSNRRYSERPRRQKLNLFWYDADKPRLVHQQHHRLDHVAQRRHCHAQSRCITCMTIFSALFFRHGGLPGYRHRRSEQERRRWGTYVGSITKG